MSAEIDQLHTTDTGRDEKSRYQELGRTCKRQPDATPANINGERWL
jgi:hypothetical protein